MSFLRRLIGGKDPAAQARRAFDQGEYARFITLCRENGLEQTDPFDELLHQAREILCERNLEEARLRRSQGDLAAFEEHLALAKEYGATTAQLDELKSAIDGEEPSATTEAAVAGCAGCGASGDGHTAEAIVANDGLAEDEEWELFLAAMPEEMEAAYRGKSDIFRAALLAANRSEDDAACRLFEQCPAEDRDAHYLYEYGAALCRCDNLEAGLDCLERSVDLLPELRHAWELLFELFSRGVAMNDFVQRLERLADNSRMAGFAAQLLARLAWQEKRPDDVLRWGERALQAGEAQAELLQMLANLLEERGEEKRAESLLAKLPVIGCGGTVHPLLAEFWLRRDRNLDRALESFKAAGRQDPGNPRWPLRIAEVYIRRGWKKEARQILASLTAAANLSPEMKQLVSSRLEELS
ncbi:tetratricopeptide repeat protein [Geothermobacter ehrlichii]|uniref:Tetratricopeptide repeat protein n=1 Tax=Geothermobacter ehrlichii TaxID=213224 RepID=A0A5D3WP71_9BACT|nr:tetratricopeptide repeat protein [Geothermobacter ehrlichii]TYP00335.1 tetratricopeptide repeat protein [Geothermobacter ehrlichii]